MKKLVTKEYATKNGYRWTTQKVGNVSHLIISDLNLYPDEDSRSNDYWRLNGGLLLPINDDEDLEEVSKLFKFKK